MMALYYKQNNFKIIIFLLLFLALLLCCLVALQNPGRYTTPLIPSKIIIIILSLLGLIVFPYISYFFIKWLFQKQKGVEINDNGIYNGLYFLKINFIPWEEIVDISNPKKNGEKRIKILVKRPFEFLEGSDFLTQTFMQIQIRISKTPIYINPYFLKTPDKEIYKELIGKWEEYKKD